MSDQSAHSFRFVQAPANLAGYLNSLYVLQVGEDGLQETLPAYSGQLLLVARGRGEMDFGRGPEEGPEAALLIGPLTSASRFSIHGPGLILGASFNFLGWAAITSQPVAQSSDRFLTTRSVFSDENSNRLIEISREVGRARLDEMSALAELADILGEAKVSLPPSHVELIECTYGWLSSGLNPKMDDLYGALSLSNRQVQRLVGRFFGLPPSSLRRRFRAIRAATMLSDSSLDATKRDEVLEAFYDQAHMIREIRKYTGRTPRLLSGGQDSVISDTLGAKGYSVVDIFGGNEEEQLAKRNR